LTSLEDSREEKVAEIARPRALPWYALHVRTRGEVKLQQALSSKGYETFLPTYLESRRYSDRLKKVNAPLFPGYLFCRMDVSNRLPLVVTPGLHSIVGTLGVPQVIEEEEILAIQRVMGAGIPAVPWPYLKAGDRVVVQYGSLKGVEGLLVRGADSDNLVLSIHLLQRAISLEIDRAWVKPLDLQKPVEGGG
jgi:transcription antitermination factor NusG